MRARLPDDQLSPNALAQRRYREDPENRLKAAIRNRIHHALKRGWLVKLPCQDCGTWLVEAHHANGYDLEHALNDSGMTHTMTEGWGKKPEVKTASYQGDSGGYSRFFLIPKADRSDREPPTLGIPLRGSGPDPRLHTAPRRLNGHPTVKPTDLMRHLIRLVTPTGGTVLDPFLGSGSTAIACELEGFPWIGIEKEPEYVAIAEARLNGVQRGLGLDVGAPVRKRTIVPGAFPANADSTGAINFGERKWTGRRRRVMGDPPEEAA
jgi:hypothetical protein